jgi:hypothetical protein
LFEGIKAMKKGGEKAVIFSQVSRQTLRGNGPTSLQLGPLPPITNTHTSLSLLSLVIVDLLLDIIQTQLHEAGHSLTRIDGSMTREARANHGQFDTKGTNSPIRLV